MIKKTSSGEDQVVFEMKSRGGHGAGKHKAKCALGIRFPFESLDIFVGAWCAAMIPHASEEEFAPSEGDHIPEFAKYLHRALEHPYYSGNLGHMLRDIDADFVVRGLPDDRRLSFRNRIQAQKLLLDNSGTNGMCIPAHIWNQKRIAQRPGAMWSECQ